VRKARNLITVGLIAAALAALACSPEDGRKRGGRGGDIGNRPSDSADVEFHGKTDPAYRVPTVGQAVNKR
jgi:hypothetical protein